MPDLYRLIDWSIAPQFLDKELQSIDQPAKKGRRFVDKLVGVRLLSGVEKGQSDLLLGMIQHRFGSVSDDIIQRLHAINSDQPTPTLR